MRTLTRDQRTLLGIGIAIALFLAILALSSVGQDPAPAGTAPPTEAALYRALLTRCQGEWDAFHLGRAPTAERLYVNSCVAEGLAPSGAGTR